MPSAVLRYGRTTEQEPVRLVRNTVPTNIFLSLLSASIVLDRELKLHKKFYFESSIGIIIFLLISQIAQNKKGDTRKERFDDIFRSVHNVETKRIY